MNKELLQMLNQFSGLRVLVIGEGILDIYLKGSYDHLSSEAPVPVIDLTEREDVPGGAANTAINLSTLGAQVDFISIIGDDKEGALLRSCLETHGIGTEGVFAHPHRQTLAKHRLLADTQMLARFDQGTTAALDRLGEDALIARLVASFSNCDAVILSDYDYGVFTPRVVAALEKLQRRDARIIVADSKQLLRFTHLNLSAVKPNYKQAIELLNLPRLKELEDRVAQIEVYGPAVLDLLHTQIAAVTIDRDGALVFERERPVYRTYARPAPYSSTTGAGDTFVSALTLALSAGAQTPTAAEVASAAAATVVRKSGTAACYREELIAYFSGDDRILSDRFQLAAWVAAYRHQGRKIVFTNGCFDILHRGHITYLNQAKSFGDVLIVGLNTDEGVARLKGPDRPINSLEDRAEVLSALSCVDHIISFHEDTPIELIRIIGPDVFVKGGDYTRETLPEVSLVEALGGKVKILPYIKDQSTTRVIEKIRGQIEDKPKVEPKAVV
jgi:D-beta-D-heptose 7-phosphate kinase/D-beta-D-heptose 1-phosphate adenosyltransferase